MITLPRRQGCGETTGLQPCQNKAKTGDITREPSLQTDLVHIRMYFVMPRSCRVETVEKLDLSQLFSPKRPTLGSSRWGPPFGVLFTRRSSTCSPTPALTGRPPGRARDVSRRWVLLRIFVQIAVWNAMFQRYLSKLSKNKPADTLSYRYGEHGGKMFVFLRLFVHAAVRGGTCAFTLKIVNTLIKNSSRDDRPSIST